MGELVPDRFEPGTKLDCNGFGDAYFFFSDFAGEEDTGEAGKRAGSRAESGNEDDGGVAGGVKRGCESSPFGGEEGGKLVV